MKQLIIRSGIVEFQEVPMPTPGSGDVLIRVLASAVSLGTEKSIISESGKGYFGQIKERPSVLLSAIKLLRTSGLRKTIHTASAVVSGIKPLGYSCCGQVVEIGRNVTDILPGDFVAAGGSTANHAELVSVPRNLVVKIPEDLDSCQASLATIGSIATHAIRRTECDFGEIIAIIGLGIIGILTAKIALSAGLTPVVYDPLQNRVSKALETSGVLGSSNLKEFERIINEETMGHGVDAAIVCATTKSNMPLDTSTKIVRMRGKIVIVGAVPIIANRDDLYENEAVVTVSRSYGPGRYDRNYEDKGMDYPLAYVRWTENRNMQFFIDQLHKGTISVDDITTVRVPFDESPRFYNKIISNHDSPLCVIIEYSPFISKTSKLLRESKFKRTSVPSGKPRIGIIGAGQFAQSTLMPAIKRHGGIIHGICNKNPLSACAVAEKFDASYSTTSINDLLLDDATDAVVISSPHNLHAEQILQVRKAGKPVFVEKPITIIEDDLRLVADTVRGLDGFTMVGFNRRYSPLSELAKDIIGNLRGQKLINYEVHAEKLSDDHWLNDPELGGGRLIGECCHFFDLMRYLLNTEWTQVHAFAIPSKTSPSDAENFVVSIRWKDNSLSTLSYIATGSSNLSKEFIRINGDNDSIELYDFKKLNLSLNDRKSVKLKTQDKGHDTEMKRFIDSLTQDGISIQSFDDAVLSMELTFAVAQSIRLGKSISNRGVDDSK